MSDTANANEIAINDIGDEAELLRRIDDTILSFKDGDLVKGKVVRISKDEVYVDVGYKTEGLIPNRELSIKHNADPFQLVHIGEEIEALVLEKEDKEGRLIISKKRAQTERAWVEIQKKKESGEKVTGEVIDVVKGGLIIDIGIKGFLPASLVDVYKIQDLKQYLGQVLEMKIVDIDRVKNNIVLSRKDFLEEARNEHKEEFMKGLEVGQIRKGKVSSLVGFGAFIDLGEGIDGLVHLTEIAWKHIVHPGDLLKIGDEVNVEVVGIDFEEGRISLSIKNTQENPWQVFARNHVIGQIVEGTVVKLVSFGAFVDLGNNVDGLIHISELSSRHVQQASHVLKRGDKVYGKIIDIDLDDKNRKISLSLRQANESFDITSEEFDPAVYGMKVEYDDAGNYKFPEGFDPQTNSWLDGFDDAKKAWEDDYGKAHSLWLKHREQVERFNQLELGKQAEEDAAGDDDTPSSYSSDDKQTALASDDALANLKSELESK
jgi:small subunit ribosomal protein S1